MKKRMLAIITIMAVLMTMVPGSVFASGYQSGNIWYEWSSNGKLIFRGENVCGIKTNLDTNESVAIPHQYYFVDTGYKTMQDGMVYELYELRCSFCEINYGQGPKLADGNIYIFDLDGICGKRHFVFDQNGNKLRTEACNCYDASYESKQTHCYYCKCGVQVLETEHTLQTKIEKATIKNNGSRINYCPECKEYFNERVIYRPKSFTLSNSKYVNYSGKKAPKLTVKASNGKIISSKYYKVTKVSGSKAAKKYKYTITFKGDYKGTKYLTFIYKNGKWV